jgi:predicted nucleic acid-binding protein
MKRPVLWDSSAILAILDASDANHDTATKIARRLATEEGTSFITNYLEAETHALLLRKLGRLAARTWLLAGPLPVIRTMQEDEQAARALIATHDDKDWSFCDAVSFALCRRLRVPRAFSFDRHFVQFGHLEVLGDTRRTPPRR